MADHHLIPRKLFEAGTGTYQSGSQAVNDMGAFLRAFAARTGYNNNAATNLFSMSIDDVEAENLGFAKHGSHVQGYDTLTERFIRDVIAKHGAESVTLSQAQADQLMSKRLVGFQNELRSMLTASLPDGSGASKSEISLVKDKYYTLDANDSYVNILANTTNDGTMLAKFESRSWYGQEFASGISNVDNAIFKMDTGVKALERARAKAAFDFPSLHNATKDIDFNKGSYSNIVTGGGALKLTAAAIVLGSAAKVAHDSGLTFQQAWQIAQQKLPPDAWGGIAFGVIQGEIQDAAIARAASMAFGPAGVAAVVAVDLYQVGRTVLKILVQVYPNQPIFQSIDTALDKLESTIGSALHTVVENIVQALGFTDLIVVSGETTALVGDGGAGSQLMFGQDKAIIKGGAGNDWMIHFGSGEADGGDGNDTVIGIFPDKLSPTEVLELKGGAGNDWVIAVGGEEASLMGGAGSDLLIGWSGRDNMWGGDGTGAPDNAADTFVISGNTIVHDAGFEDHIMWGPLPLTGGSQQWWTETNYAYWTPFTSVLANLGWLSATNAAAFAASAIVDAVFSQIVRYGVTKDGHLQIEFLRGRAGVAGVLNYEVIYDTLDSTGNVMLYKVLPTGGSLADLKKLLAVSIKAATGFTPIGTDPLVIDLDGDGIELTRNADGVYFDIDNDGFAERTSWVRGDDALLARDVNANGKIDSQGELFGTATVNGFTALKALDTNNDNVINASDTAFSSLSVWRDLNKNGVTDAGELQSLTAVGIQSISLAYTTSGVTTIAENQKRIAANDNESLLTEQKRAAGF